MKDFFSKQPILSFGSLLGLFIVAHSLILNALNLQLKPSITASVISLVVTTGIIFLGVFTFKKQSDSFSIGNGLKIGISISVLGAIIYIAYMFLYIYSINPNFINESLEITKHTLLKKGLKPTEINKSLATTRNAFVPSMILSILIFNVFIGFIVSFISSLLLKSKK